MAIIEIKNLTHTFADGTTAIKDININIDEGEFVIISGSNGSGKTVFIRHINGLLYPTKGEVFVDGKPIKKNIFEARKKIGMIFQDSDSQIVGQTVWEDVAFGPENLGFPIEKINEIVEKSLRDMNILEYKNQNPHLLSGGQKKRLAIAGVLSMEPKVLIFDEPFTGLDYPSVLLFLKSIIDLHKNNHTIILVTHDLEKVLAYATRLVIFHNGTIVEDGDVLDVIHRCEQYGVRMPLIGALSLSDMTWNK